MSTDGSDMTARLPAGRMAQGKFLEVACPASARLVACTSDPVFAPYGLHRFYRCDETLMNNGPLTGASTETSEDRRASC